MTQILVLKLEAAYDALSYESHADKIYGEDPL